MNTALLLSGGTGSRIPSNIPKQYIHVNSRMLVTYALEPLLTFPLIHRVVIVAEQAWQEAIVEDVRRAGLDFGLHRRRKEAVEFQLCGF